MSASEGIEGGWAFPARLGDRSLFPDLEPRVYINHAAISPPSLAVRHAAAVVMDDYARRGAGAFVRWIEQRRRLKGKLATLIGAAPDDLALTLNTTRGVSDIALCYPWNPGDRVIVFEGEFPANVTPWQRAAAAFGLEVVSLPVSILSGDPPDLERLRAALERGARVVAVSAVEFQSGLRTPLAEISALCRAHGAELSVDAVQACGAVPIDVGAMGIDYLACGSHKWLMGLPGAGFVYAAPHRVEALRPHVAGWLSHEDGIDFLFRGPGHLRYDRPIKKRIELIEGGNLNDAGLAGLEASLDALQTIGVEAIWEHANRILDSLEPALVERGFSSLRSKDVARRSCILSALPPEGVSVVALQREMAAHGVSCSIPDGVIRFSPHWPNHPDEVAVVLAALDESIAAARA